MTTIFTTSLFLLKTLKLTSHSNAVNLRSFRLSAMNTSAMASNNGNGGVVRFPLSSSNALIIQKGDITKWSIDGSTDAIVNPANERMLGGGGADGAIHRAAGPDLLRACRNVPEVRPGVRCPTGEARITPGFLLPASHVIHTVGPIHDVDSNPAASLASAYRNSLRVAKENNIQYIAFPAISCGVYGYPYDEAATVAISTIKEFQNDFKEDPNGRRVRVNYATESWRPSYSVPSSYHGSHLKTSYADDGEISIFKGGLSSNLAYDYEIRIMNGEFKLLDALESISEVIPCK